jgi:hypothetical protein
MDVVVCLSILNICILFISSKVCRKSKIKSWIHDHGRNEAASTVCAVDPARYTVQYPVHIVPRFGA